MVAFIDNLMNVVTVAGGEIADNGGLANNVLAFGVATYLLLIAFGLYTIVNVIRLQLGRIRERAEDDPYAA